MDNPVGINLNDFWIVATAAGAGGFGAIRRFWGGERRVLARWWRVCGLEAVWKRFGNGFGAVSGMLVESEQLQTDSGQFPIVFGVEFLSASSEQFQGNSSAIPVHFGAIPVKFRGNFGAILVQFQGCM